MLLSPAPLRRRKYHSTGDTKSKSVLQQEILFVCQQSQIQIQIPFDRITFVIGDKTNKNTKTNTIQQREQYYTSRDLEKKLFGMGLEFTKQNTTEVYEVLAKY